MDITPALLDRLCALVGAENVSRDPETCLRAVSGWPPLASKARSAETGGGLPVPRPAAVVRPEGTNEVAALVQWANETGTRLCPVGGASNTVASGATGAGVVAVDLLRLNETDLDETSLLVHAGAGVNIGQLEAQLNDHGYTLGFAPQSAALMTVGGAVAANAVGAMSGRYGRAADLARRLTVVLPTGDILETAAPPHASAYHNLHGLFAGSEGTLGIITRASLQIHPVPEARAWAAFTFGKFADGLDALRLVYRSDARPATALLLDPAAAADLLRRGTRPAGVALLLMAFEGDEQTQTGPYQLAYAVCEATGGTAAQREPNLGELWWEGRAGANWLAPNARPDALADAVALSASWTNLSAVHKATRAALAPLVTRQSARVGHAYPDGASLEIQWEAPASVSWQRITDAALTACHENGGAIAHHYGVGATRAPALLTERGLVGAAALRALKAAFDPRGVLPGLGG